MKALAIVDMQYDFMPSGPLGVPGADYLPILINRLIPKFPLVFATLDWHPIDHVSFAFNHSGKHVGDVVKIDSVEQVLWPIHCVQNTRGSELTSAIDTQSIHHYVRKGIHTHIDSYSSFFDNARQRSTGLEDYLKSQKITDLYFTGVATDYCVLYSVLDAIELGFRVFVIIDGCRSICLEPHDEHLSIAAMAAAGATIMVSHDLLQ